MQLLLLLLLLLLLPDTGAWRRLLALANFPRVSNGKMMAKLKFHQEKESLLC
jgi:hypothetical protein